MGFIELTRDLFENVTISLTPKISFVSGSTVGITGSEYVAPVRSKCIKEIKVLDHSALQEHPYKLDFSNTNKSYDESDSLVIEDYLKIASNKIIVSGITTVKNYINRYMQAVNDAPKEIRFNKNFNITRFEPPHSFATGTIIKNNIRNVLMPHYEHAYDDCGFYYRNYHTLNFFTASHFTTSSALLYRNDENAYTPGYGNNRNHDFTLQFWINPRYRNSSSDQSFNAGTIFHMSSSIAVSLISGSQKTASGLTDSYKILAQFEKGSEINPSLVSFPTTQGYTSSFELKHNNWHHVTVRWGGKYKNNFTGSIVIDNNVTEFAIPSSSLANSSNPNITIGNFCESSKPTFDKTFDNDGYTKEGVTDRYTIIPNLNANNGHFPNPLNAEIHEIKLYDTYLSDAKLKNTGSGVTKSDIKDDRLLFYVPPYFYPEMKLKEYTYSPFFKVTTSSHAPINPLFAFSCGGREISLENFTKEYIQNRHPRAFNLTASVLLGGKETADNFTYSLGNKNNLKRNFTILPNDNGQFSPDYHVIKKLAEPNTQILKHFRLNKSASNYDIIKLEDLILTSSNFTSYNRFNHQSNTSLFNRLMGNVQSGIVDSGLSSLYEDEIKASIPNPILSLVEELKDTSSNLVTIFGISNLFYGNRIHPGSLEIIDNNLTGSLGKINIKLKDNKRGGMYRANCETKQADWNVVGNVFYDEGLVIIKSPHLTNFCKDRTEINLKGEQNIHSLVLNVPCPRSYLNSSSNPTFTSLPKSDNINDENTETFQITGVNIHDENFNIIMRANFAQPILKDKTDEFIIRLKQDF